MSADRSRDKEESSRLEESPKERMERNEGLDVSRRTFLRLGALAGAGASVPALWNPAPAAAETAGGAAPARRRPGDNIEEVTIAEMQAAMTGGGLTSLELVNLYLERIATLDQSGPNVNSVIEVNPQAREIARARDRERKQKGPRGPLHGIPILLKDNIDTGDRMMTTAGSLALVGDSAPQDATVVARLRAAGAVILGKTNLSEWANFRSFHSSSGWSARGGQTRNPYVLDRSPCGSSSGSGAAVSANFAAVSLGTETDGSIVCPASANGVVGIKPTVGLTSRAGVIPIAHSQDTVGPYGRTVADAAAVLGAIAGPDPRDPQTAASAGRFHTDYTQFLDPNGLRGARIGVPRQGGFWGYSEETDAIVQAAIDAMAEAGATIVDETEFPSIDAILADSAEIIVLVREFKQDLNAYLATRTGVPVRTLADVIQFNLEHADVELKYFLQEWLELTEAEIFSQQEYEEALERSHRLSREEGIDAVLAEHDLDALVAPTGSPAWPIDLVNGDHFLGASSYVSAMAGYPIINVTAGYAFGLPVGVSFMGTAYSEPTLIKLASGFEHVYPQRRAPRFLPTLPLPTGTNALTGRDEAVLAARADQARLERLKARMLSTLPKIKARLHGL